MNPRTTDLHLCSETTRYSLASRGVRVISGRSEDVEAADSNGAGKSALVMAPAWALTGRSDARAEVGCKEIMSAWLGGIGRPSANSQMFLQERGRLWCKV